MSLTLRTWILCAVCFSTLGLPPAIRPASADPVTVLSGSVFVFDPFRTFGGAHFQLHGTEGFRFDAIGEGFLDACVRQDPDGKCHGGIGPAGGAFGGFIGDATVHGRDFSFNPIRSDVALGQITVGGFVPAPLHASGDVQFMFPASLAGHVHFQNFPEGGEEFDADVDLTGFGFGTLNAFASTRDGETVYSIDSLRFDFGQSAATPEPSSLILLSSGLGVGWWQRRRRRVSLEA